MNIVIMRHGQAQARATTDFERPLTALGVEQAIAAGACLSTQDFQIDEVWVSPYLRTQQTADHVMSQLPACPRVTVAALVPEAELITIRSALEESETKNLLLVSHQPLVSSLVATLSAAKFHIPMSPASMALLTAPLMAAGCAHLQWLRHAPEFERE
jgi:phosphohistidine phosphatase